MKKLLVLAVFAVVVLTSSFSYADTESSIEVGRMEQEIQRTQEQLEKIRQENEPAIKGDNTTEASMPGDEWDYSVDD